MVSPAARSGDTRSVSAHGEVVDHRAVVAHGDRAGGGDVRRRQVDGELGQVGLDRLGGDRGRPAVIASSRMARPMAMMLAKAVSTPRASTTIVQVSRLMR